MSATQHTDRINPNRSRTALAGTRARRHQFHAAHRAPPRLFLRRRAHHRADIQRAFASRGSVAMAVAVFVCRKPTELFAQSQPGNQHYPGYQKQDGLQKQFDPPPPAFDSFRRRLAAAGDWRRIGGTSSTDSCGGTDFSISFITISPFGIAANLKTPFPASAAAISRKEDAPRSAGPRTMAHAGRTAGVGGLLRSASSRAKPAGESGRERSSKRWREATAGRDCPPRTGPFADHPAFARSPGLWRIASGGASREAHRLGNTDTLLREPGGTAIRLG